MVTLNAQWDAMDTITRVSVIAHAHWSNVFNAVRVKRNAPEAVHVQLFNVLVVLAQVSQRKQLHLWK